MYARDPITVVEVGPRDGLQYESAFFPTEKKIALINMLAEAGLTRLEISSFVHPKIIPQFSDVMDVIEGRGKKAGGDVFRSGAQCERLRARSDHAN
jgi:hydroxymethylglutaryl-CoA lyase